MKHTRKITALLLCAAMAFTPVISPVYAVDTDEPQVSDSGRSYGSLSITKLPDKLYYHIGEELDLTGGEATGGGFVDGAKCDIFPCALTSLHVNDAEFDNTKPGTYTIYVSSGLNNQFMVAASFDVVVLKDGEEAPADDAPLRKSPAWTFHITSLPKKLTYQIGEELDLTGGTGYGIWTEIGDEPFIASLSQFHVNASEFDSSTPGVYPVYVSFTQDGRSVSDGFLVTVEEPEETTLPTTGKPSEKIFFNITQTPDKVVYKTGEALDLTGGKAFAGGEYDDGSGNVMCWDAFEQPMTYYTVDASEFNNTRPGTYKIYLTCKGQLESKTISFEVRVEGDPIETVPPTTLPPTTDPTEYSAYDDFWFHFPKKQFYKLGDDLNMTGAYGFAGGEQIPLSDARFSVDKSEYDNTKPGVYTIYVTFRDGSFQRTEDYSVMVLNADGTAPDGYPTPTGEDNPYTPTNSTAPTGTDDTQETTQALDRLYKNDINGDGTADIMDIIVLNKHLLGVYQMSGLERTFADVNGDGVIDAADSLALLKKVLGVSDEDDPVEPTEVPTTEFVDPTGNCKIPPDEVTEPVTEPDSGIAPVKYSEHFYGAKVVRGTASDGYQNSIDVVTDANNSLFGLYGPDFYKDNNLIIVQQTESSGSYRLTVKDVTVDADGIYTVHIERFKPSVATCDLARWYIYVATDKGLTDADHVKLEFTDILGA